MKKSKLKKIVLTLFLLLFLENIKAATCNCVYTGQGTGSIINSEKDVKITLKFNFDNKTVVGTVEDSWFDGFVTHDVYIVDKYLRGNLDKIFNYVPENKCPSSVILIGIRTSSFGIFEALLDGILDSNALDAVGVLIDTGAYADFINVGISFEPYSLSGNGERIEFNPKSYYETEVMHYYYLISDNNFGGNISINDSNCDSVDVKFDCDTFDNYKEEVDSNPCKNNDKCSIKDRQNYNQSKDRLVSYCKSVVSNSSHYDPCLKSCLKLDLNNNKFGENTCGFSGRLILFVGNIIKWCKYIVPVIAIVLSILDFIKAIGAGKEDEMKKAQGKFIKRLIVAGLVFIMPFIIEFVLNKMGFEANGCGIIDL